MLSLSKLKEIIEAWAIAAMPTPEQKNRAVIRYAICNSCEYNKKEVCSLCGCPLDKKVFSTRMGACDIGKWDKVDGL